MVYKFRLISDEVKDFVRDIEILSEQTFYDLHCVMIHDFRYDKSQLASIFLTTRSWEKLQEFTLFDMSEEGKIHTLLMDKSVLKDYITDSKQRMLTFLICLMNVSSSLSSSVRQKKLKKKVSLGSHFPVAIRQGKSFLVQ